MTPQYKVGDKFDICNCVMRIVNVVVFPERVGYELEPDNTEQPNIVPGGKVHFFEKEMRDFVKVV